MERSEFRFAHRLRVRWPEVDAQQIVFNGQYLAYFDVANSAYWRAAALPYPQGFARFGGDTVVKKATVEYHLSAGYDEFIDVGMTCSRIGTSSLTFGATFFRGISALATAEVVYVFVDASTRRPRAVPDDLRQAVVSFEAGEPSTRTSLGPWNGHAAAVRSLRDEEQADPESTHAVVLDRFGAALATGRLAGAGASDMEIGGVVVRSSMRGAGIGRAVVTALADEARERGATGVFAQPSPTETGFFQRVGFRADGSGRLRWWFAPVPVPVKKELR